MTLDDLVPPAVTAAVADLGLHKIAGAMHGVPELDLGVALRTLGERAYRRRKEARAIADGIAAYATVTGEKIAENPALMALLRRSAMPAMMGAGIAAIPHMMSQDPQEHTLRAMLPSLLAGGLVGGTAGGVSALHDATRGPMGSQIAPDLAANLMHSPAP